MAAASTTARSTTATTTPATTASRSTTAAAISTAVWTIAGATFSRARRGYAGDRITIEVRLIVGKIAATFNRQSRRTNFTVAFGNSFCGTFASAINSTLAAAHFRALLFQNRFAR